MNSEPTVTASSVVIDGIRIATAAAGIRKAEKTDLCVFEIAPGAAVAGVFTQNVFCAAPVTVTREHLALDQPRVLVINSGNANAGTGTAGLKDAREVCRLASELVACRASAVLPFSTGVIGQRLPVERIAAALPRVVAHLASDRWDDAARAIMTTDTVPKLYSAQVQCGAQRYSITGIAKGAGMIKPDMATMLAFIATDAAVPKLALQELLSEIAHRTFNRITIDGDTSTNDSCMLIATGHAARGRDMHPADPDWSSFVAGVTAVCKALSRAIVRDGEGATKLVAVQVSGGRSEAECRKAAYAVAESPLVKTALFASDPNWGRILAAVGRSGVSGLRIEDISIALNDYPIINHGEPLLGYDERIAAEIMATAEFDIRISIGDGSAAIEVLTCDFSYDYVRINAEYRS